MAAQTVKTPMAVDLDGNGHNIANVEQVKTNGHAYVGSGLIHLDLMGNRPSVVWGSDDPRLDPRAAGLQPGTLYLRFANPAEAWLQVGSTQDTFRQLAFVP